MASKKITVSLPEEIVEQVAQLVAHSGTTVSAWIAHAAEEQARIEHGLAALDEWARESGPLTPAELTQAHAILANADAAMAGMKDLPR